MRLSGRPIGDEFRKSVLEGLTDIARIALERHDFLSRHKITNSDDLAAFDHDFTELEQAVREIGIDVKKLHRWYRQKEDDESK